VPLPFALPTASRALAAVTPAARRLGAEAAAAAARVLGQVLEREVAIRGWPAVGPPSPRAATSRLCVELAALPAVGCLEVEAALAARLLDLLAGGEGASPAATRLTPLEESALELFCLLALDGACAVPGVEPALGPRLSRQPPPPPGGALGLELELEAGPVRGRARLLLPAEAVRAAGGEPDPAASPLRLPASLRRGSVSLLPGELEGLAPGDAVLVDAPPGERTALVLPGGFRAEGILAPDGLHVEETTMSVRCAQVPVTLEVELCRVELSLGELARLAPGAVVPLPVDRRGEVALRAGDRAVARGELVELDGAIAVRIASLEGEP
jgi:type III secretion protein Q